MFIYSNQKCNVRWGNALSSMYKMESDKEQFLPQCYSVIYMDKVIKLLRCSTIGCQIQCVYMGIWEYADDISLLSHSRTGLQEMVKICQHFVKATKLKFSTNIWIECKCKCKTKCLTFSKERVNYNNPNFTLWLPLPFVINLKHLGNVIIQWP